MRRTIATLALAATLALGATGCGLIDGGSDGGGDAQQENPDGTADDSTEDGSAGNDGDDANADGSGAATTSDAEPIMLEETIASATIEVGGTTLVFDLKGVTTNSESATVHGVLANTGDADAPAEFFDMNLVPQAANTTGSITQWNMLTITDSATGNLHTPAYTSDGHCLCTQHSGALEPGESIAVFAQYAPLSEETQSVVVNFGPMGSFANIPVTRS